MLSLNVIFHIGAAVALVILLVHVARLRRELKAARHLVRSLNPAGPGGRLVDWPAPFLARLARLVQCQATGLEALARDAKPVRMDAAPWVAFAARQGLVALRCEDGAGAKRLVLTVARMPDDPAAEARALEAALNIGYTVSIEAHASRPAPTTAPATH